MEKIGEVLEKAKRAAVEYYELTGRPLGITGEVGEYEAERRLGLTLEAPRTRGRNAVDQSGRLYKIISRALTEAALMKSQQTPAIRPDHEWDAVVLVLMNEKFEVQEIWEAEKKAAIEVLNKHFQMSVSKFKQIGQRVWPS